MKLLYYYYLYFCFFYFLLICLFFIFELIWATCFWDRLQTWLLILSEFKRIKYTQGAELGPVCTTICTRFDYKYDFVILREL